MTFEKITSLSSPEREEGKRETEDREGGYFYIVRDKSGFPNCARVCPIRPPVPPANKCFLLHLHKLSLFVSVQDSSEAAAAAEWLKSVTL